jgi:hypothetical protein
MPIFHTPALAVPIKAIKGILKCADRYRSQQEPLHRFIVCWRMFLGEHVLPTARPDPCGQVCLLDAALPYKQFNARVFALFVKEFKEIGFTVTHMNQTCIWKVLLYLDQISMLAAFKRCAGEIGSHKGL